jgi:hypothetical protein
MLSTLSAIAAAVDWYKVAEGVGTILGAIIRAAF